MRTQAEGWAGLSGAIKAAGDLCRPAGGRLPRDASRAGSRAIRSDSGRAERAKVIMRRPAVLFCRWPFYSRPCCCCCLRRSSSRQSNGRAAPLDRGPLEVSGGPLIAFRRQKRRQSGPARRLARYGNETITTCSCEARQRATASSAPSSGKFKRHLSMVQLDLCEFHSAGSESKQLGDLSPSLFAVHLRLAKRPSGPRAAPLRPLNIRLADLAPLT